MEVVSGLFSVFSFCNVHHLHIQESMLGKTLHYIQKSKNTILLQNQFFS